MDDVAGSETPLTDGAYCQSADIRDVDVEEGITA